MEISSENLGKLLIEGKTKKVLEIKENSELVYVLSKDRITAGDGLKSHEMEGKSKLSTQTNCAIFEFLNFAKIPTHFVNRVINNKDSERSFVAKKCQMIPIEWVSRRVATGSFLKRNPNVYQGYRFCPPKLETFFKDDSNHDPYWSKESIICAKFQFNGLLIDELRVTQMFKLSQLVFELLERVWKTKDHTLIDMKIEFGVTTDGSIVVADVIDNDSWRLWPKGEKRLQLDKQLYRDLQNIDQQALNKVKESFEIVAKRTTQLFCSIVLEEYRGEVAIICGSVSDKNFAQKIVKSLSEKFNINDVTVIVSSAHKSTENTLNIISRLESKNQLKAIIALAGLSNGLGPVLAANTTIPVITCPPIESLESLSIDIWSSLRLPSGIGLSTVLGYDNVAQSVALIIGLNDVGVWSLIRSQQTLTQIKLLLS